MDDSNSEEERRTHQVVSDLTKLRGEMLQAMQSLTQIRAKYQDALAVYQKTNTPINDMSQLFQNVANNEALGPIIILIPLTSAYVPLAKNFLCYLRALDDPPNVLIWAADDETFSLLQDWTPNVFKFSDHYTSLDENDKPLREHNLKLPLPGDSLYFQRLMLGRNRIAHEALQSGYHVLLADIDQVWQENPLTYLTRADRIIVRFHEFVFTYSHLLIGNVDSYTGKSNRYVVFYFFSVPS